MNDHPNKHIRKAIDYALGNGWKVGENRPTRSCLGTTILPGASKGRLHDWRLRHPARTRKPCPVYSQARRCLSSLKLERAQGVMHMKTYEFNVVLKDVSEIMDDQADRLFGAGCDDGTPTS